jgi:hypothetical protein
LMPSIPGEPLSPGGPCAIWSSTDIQDLPEDT